MIRKKREDVMSTVEETSRLLQYRFFDCARTCC